MSQFLDGKRKTCLCKPERGVGHWSHENLKKVSLFSTWFCFLAPQKAFCHKSFRNLTFFFFLFNRKPWSVFTSPEEEMLVETTWSMTLFDLFEIYIISFYVCIDLKLINTEYFLNFLVWKLQFFSLKTSELHETMGQG